MPSINGSGAGAMGAGVGPAGHTAPEDVLPGPAERANAANEFDPFTGLWTQTSTLSLEATSPVMQRAAFLLLPVGSVASTPDDGIDLQGVRRARPNQREAAVRAALERTWSSLIAAKELVIDSIEIDPSEPWNGRWVATVTDATTGQSRTLST